MSDPRTELTQLMHDMDVPPAKAQMQSDTDIHWLGRNLGLNNASHPQIDRARTLLEELGARLVM